MGLALCSNTVMADPITITNASFDDDDINAISEGQSWANQDPTGWTGDGGAGANVFQELSGTPGVPWTSGDDGPNHATSGNDADLFQDLGTTYAANTIYTLDVAVGIADGQTAATNAIIALAQTDGTILAQTSIDLAAQLATAPGTSFMLDHQVQYTADGTEGAIRILLDSNANGVRASFDNVRLDATAIPEPGSVTLFGLAMAGTAFMRRRRRS